MIFILLTIMAVAQKDPILTSPSYIIAILGLLIGTSGIAGWLTVRNQNRSMAVEAADNAVDAVNKALDRVEKELAFSRKEIERLTQALDSARDKAASERGVLQERITQLQERVHYLEEVVEKYRRRAEDNGEEPPNYQGPEKRSEYHRRRNPPADPGENQ